MLLPPRGILRHPSRLRRALDRFSILLNSRELRSGRLESSLLRDRPELPVAPSRLPRLSESFRPFPIPPTILARSGLVAHRLHLLAEPFHPDLVASIPGLIECVFKFRSILERRSTLWTGQFCG